MFKYPSRYVRKLLKKESELEKPYATGQNYRRMHLDLPRPSWPSWSPLPIRVPILPGGPAAEDTVFPEPPPCTVWCFANKDDCSEPIWCTAHAPHGDCPGLGELIDWSVAFHEGSGQMFPDFSSLPASMQVWILLTEGIERVNVEILANAEKGALPSARFIYECECNCDTTPTLQCDWSITPYTTLQGGPNAWQTYDIDIAVQGGCPPYTWSEVGFGFSLGAFETEDENNVLKSSFAACGTCTVTVTDFCGETTKFNIRCSNAGEWEILEMQDGEYYDGGNALSDECATFLNDRGTCEVVCPVENEERTLNDVGDNYNKRIWYIAGWEAAHELSYLCIDQGDCESAFADINFRNKNTGNAPTYECPFGDPVQTFEEATGTSTPSGDPCDVDCWDCAGEPPGGCTSGLESCYVQSLYYEEWQCVD